MNVLEPVIKIKQGLIKGLRKKSLYDHEYYSYVGIPYGQPPLGELRFKAPLPAGSWTGVRDCQEFDLSPLQKNYIGETEGTEDCLYLNVFVKNFEPKEKLPVMVWIYGGAFNTGSAIPKKYRPDYFMQEQVILVTFNYRLSSLGFLSLNDPACEVPGNAGLKDQVLALKWVKDNIAYFGGDVENITLFGMSAGSASVHYMTLTEQIKDLFHKFICMSGCVLNHWALSDNAAKMGYALAREKGYRGPNEDKQVLKYLRELPAEQLVSVDSLNLEAVANGKPFAFLPCLEPYDSTGSIIRKPLEDLAKSAWGNNIPMLVGGTSSEGLVSYRRLKKMTASGTHKTNPNVYFPFSVQTFLTARIRDGLIEQLKELHFKDDNELMGFVDSDSFTSFWFGITNLVKLRQSHTDVATYQYLFDFDSASFNHHRAMFTNKEVKKGVSHADDLSYLFYTDFSWKVNTDSREYKTIQHMIKMWTNFAKTSNPNCEYTTVSPWKTVQESDAQKWLRISDDLKFEEMPEDFKKKLKFWQNIYETYSEPNALPNMG